MQFASWSAPYFAVHSLRLNRSRRTSCQDGNCTGLLFREKLVSGRPGGKKNLCAIPMPPLKSRRQSPGITICFRTLPSSGRTNGTGPPGSCSTPLPRGLEGGNLPLGHRGNGYTDS